MGSPFAVNKSVRILSGAFGFYKLFNPKFFTQIAHHWFRQHASIRKKDSRHTPKAAVDGFNILAPFHILIDIDPGVSDLVFIENTPCTPAVPTPTRPINNDTFRHDIPPLLDSDP
jgi:hypothetical protein